MENTSNQIIRVEYDPAAVALLVEQGGDLIINPDAEDAILQLLELQTNVNDAVATVKQMIIDAGLAKSPHFTSVAGHTLKANYSAAGSVYQADPENVPKYRRAPYWKREVKYSIDSKAVGKYEQKHHGKLPKGMMKPERKRSLSFKVMPKRGA